MKKILLIFVLSILHIEFFAQIKEGKYSYSITVDYIKYSPEAEDSTEIIHKHTYMFKKDSVYLSVLSYYVGDQDTTLSPADGGHFFYSGKPQKVASQQYTLHLKLDSCEYCIDLNKPYFQTLEIRKNGYFIDDKKLYRVAR